MSTQDFTGATQSMTARTVVDAAHRHHEPSTRALATRSWNSVRRLQGEDRAAAAAVHFELFARGSGACRR